MKKKYYLIIGFVIILLISCGKKRKPSKIFEYSEKEINKIKKIKSEKEIMALKKEIQFNDMKEKRYDIWGIFDYNDKYIIYSKYYNGAEHPFLYDRNGNFIDKIGTFGKGPGEYIFLHSVFLKSEKDICAFDLQRNIMLFYEIKDGKVEFIEQKNLEKFFQGGANEVFYRNNKYYFLSFSGPKGGYKIYVTDENFKLINKFFKRKHEPSLIDIRYFVSDNKIFFLGACEFIKSKRETRYFEPKIYIYTLDGKFINSIDIGTRKFKNFIVVDRFIFVRIDDHVSIFDFNGNLLNEIDNYTDQFINPSHNENLMFYLNKIEKGYYSLKYYKYEL